MPEHWETPINGVLVRGSEGALYFIADEDLEQFRVSRELAEPVLRALDERSEVTGYASKRLGPQVQLVPALRGPLGRKRSPAARPTSQDPTAIGITGFDLE